MFRQIAKTETDVMRRTWEWEREFPRFYLDASQVWTETVDEACSFFRDKCSALYAAQNESGIYAVVYFETITEKVENAHLALVRGADKNTLVEDLINIRDERLRGGIREIMTWVLSKNRALRGICENVGFRATGLTMKHGTSRGKVLHWTQMLICAGG